MPPKVLVAEDDAGVRLTLEFVLLDEGFEVLFAEDGEKALQIARDTIPDVILLDRMMPRLDGKQVFDALRAEDSTRGIPVIILSGLSRDSGDDWPGAYFIGKPFAPEALVECIHEIVDGDGR
jgi:DNA-binding response OmpR family regulator